MLACGHDRTPFGAPICSHLRTCREAWINYVKWYKGSSLDNDLLCVPCADDREKGLSAPTDSVCEECFDYATTEVGDLVGTRGNPGIRIRSESFNGTLRETATPTEVGTIIDISPVDEDSRSIWLMLTQDGQLIRLDADTGEWARVARTSVPLEPDHKPWEQACAKTSAAFLQTR